MTDYFILGVIAIAVAAGVFYTVRHFKGQGGCCGGSGYKPKKKKLSHVKYRKTFQVEGMHCDHCKNRVEEIVNDISGVAGKVDLKKGLLTVSYEKDVDDSIIKARIERVGYKVIK